MKYTHSEARFIAHCVLVASFNVGVTAWPGDVDEEKEEEQEEADGAPEGGGCGGDEEEDAAAAAATGTGAGYVGSGAGAAAASVAVVAWDLWEGDDEEEEGADEESVGEQRCNESAAEAPVSEGASVNASATAEPEANPFADLAFKPR